MKYTSSRLLFSAAHMFFVVVLITGVLPEKLCAYYDIDMPKFGLSLSYEFDNQQQTGGSVGTRQANNTTQTYYETLDIRTKGWLIYPALAKFNLAMMPQMEQRSATSDSGSQSSSDITTLGYLAGLTLLPQKDYTLTLNAGRTTSTTSTTFAEKNRTEEDEYSAILNLKYRALPTMISYRLTESSAEGFFPYEETRNNADISMFFDRYLGKTEFDADYSEYTFNTGGNESSSSSHGAGLNNSYGFNNEIALNSGLRYQGSSNSSSSRTSYSINESLRWNHSKELLSSYRFNYSSSDSDNAQNENASLGFNIGSFRYRDFSASFSAGGSSNNSSGSKSQAYSSGVSLGYSRDVPGGKLNLISNHSYSVSMADSNSENELRNVEDENITLTSGVITILDRKNVVIDSIVITDQTNTITYTKDIHYSVTQTGSSTIISRIAVVINPIPAIPDGTDVLVDYTYNETDTFDHALLGQSYNANLRMWNIWNLYYSYSRSTQEALSDPGDSELSDSTIHSAGTELDWRWSRTRVGYESSDTNDISRDSLSISESISLKPHRRLSLGISGSYGITWVKSTDETAQSYGTRSFLRWHIARKLSLDASGSYRVQKGEETDDRQVEISAFLSYSLRIWKANLQYVFTNSQDLISAQETQGNMLFLKIERALF